MSGTSTPEARLYTDFGLFTTDPDFGADLTDPSSVAAMMDAARERFGSLDILVLNASGGMEGGMAEDYAMQLNRDAQVDLATSVLSMAAVGVVSGAAVLVGFGDPKSDPERAQLLSKLRAMAVRRELAKSEVLFEEIIGLGAELPVASNQADDGRIKNRRVEVWVY